MSYQAGNRSEIMVLEKLLTYYHYEGCAIAGLRGVTSSNRAICSKHRLKFCERCEGGIGPGPLIHSGFYNPARTFIFCVEEYLFHLDGDNFFTEFAFSNSLYRFLV